MNLPSDNVRRDDSERPTLPVHDPDRVQGPDVPKPASPRRRWSLRTPRRPEELESSVKFTHPGDRMSSKHCSIDSRPYLLSSPALQPSAALAVTSDQTAVSWPEEAVYCVA
jgi:hypothetical protein